jgi:hypothetical protein
VSQPRIATTIPKRNKVGTKEHSHKWRLIVKLHNDTMTQCYNHRIATLKYIDMPSDGKGMEQPELLHIVMEI